MQEGLSNAHTLVAVWQYSPAAIDVLFFNG